MHNGTLIIRNEHARTRHRLPCGLRNDGVLVLTDTLSRDAYDFCSDSFAWRPEGGRKSDEVPVEQYEGRSHFDFQVEEGELGAALASVAAVAARALHKAMPQRSAPMRRRRLRL